MKIKLNKKIIMHDKELLIFPTNRAIREYINNLQYINTFVPKMVTIGDFFQRVVTLKNKKLISSELRVIYLKQAVENIDIEKIGINGDFSSFLKQSEYILRFFNELASEFKTIQDLKEADTYALYLDHLEILENIQIKYYKILDQNNYIDQSLLPLHYQINSEYLKQFNQIKIYHEGIFSSYEQKIIDEISQLINTKIIYAKNTNIYTKNIEIFSVPQRIIQVGFVKQMIYNMITKYKLEPSKIAVILPDESFYNILSLFDDEQYFNFAMGKNIKESHIVQTIKTINKLIVDDEPYDKQKIDFFNIDKELFILVKLHWNKIVNKTLFIDIFNKLILCEINEQIIEKLEELKISFEILFFTTTLDLKLKDIFKIIQNKITKITLDDVQGGKVTVLGLLETRAISYDSVIVIDFNDDKIPKRSIKDKFLSTKVKEFINLPTSKDREELQKYYYKNLFARAKYISICYVNDEISNQSRFIKEIFPNIKINHSLNFSKILFREKQIQKFQENIILDIDLSTLSWSATSLKVFLQCKRKYYLQYIKKIQEHHISLKPKGYEVGNIIHKVLEDLSQKRFTQININNKISQYQKENPYLTLELEIWKQKLIKFIQLEEQRLSNGYQIYEVEKPFRFTYNGIILKGTIDRIDKLANNNYEILDYKTSTNLKVDTIKTYEKTNDFQLEFYYLSCQDIQIENVGYYDLNTATIKNEKMLDEKIKILDEKLIQLKTKKVDFELCTDKSTCLYCPYKIICNRL